MPSALCAAVERLWEGPRGASTDSRPISRGDLANDTDPPLQARVSSLRSCKTTGTALDFDCAAARRRSIPSVHSPETGASITRVTGLTSLGDVPHRPRCSVSSWSAPPPERRPIHRQPAGLAAITKAQRKARSYHGGINATFSRVRQSPPSGGWDGYGVDLPATGAPAVVESRAASALSESQPGPCRRPWQRTSLNQRA